MKQRLKQGVVGFAESLLELSKPMLYDGHNGFCSGKHRAFSYHYLGYITCAHGKSARSRQLLARSSLLNAIDQCPLLGVKRTLLGDAAMSANDPKRTSATPDFCSAN